jgi:hypothetical protein
MLSCRAGRATASVSSGIPNDEFYTDHILPMRYRNTHMLFTSRYDSVERAYIEAKSKKLLSCRTESELTGVSCGIPKEEFTLKHFFHRRYRNTAHALHIPSGMTVWRGLTSKLNLKNYCHAGQDVQRQV